MTTVPKGMDELRKKSEVFTNPKEYEECLSKQVGTDAAKDAMAYFNKCREEMAAKLSSEKAE